MLTRVIQFVIGVLLGAGGGYLLWSNRALAPTLFPPTTSGVPWILILGLLAAMAGAVSLVYAVHPRPERKARLAAQAAHREETLTAADDYYGKRSRAADSDWRSGNLPPTAPPRPAPAPEPVHQAEPARQPPPQPVAMPAPVTELSATARPTAMKPAAAPASPEPGQPTPFPSQATLAPIPKAAEPPPAPVQPKTAALPASPAPAPVAAAPKPAPRPVATPVPAPTPAPVQAAAPPPPAVAPAPRPAATPTVAGEPAAPAGATVVTPNFTTLSLTPAAAPPAPQQPPQPAAPILAAVKSSPPTAPTPVPAATAASAPIVLERMPPLKPAEHSFDRIRTAIREGRLVEADKMLTVERETAQGVALAELTGLAGDQAAAAGRQSNAKWLWRLALKRFSEANAMDNPAARAVAESLRLADA